jgi:multiple sugar transport system substrate-binding protein
VRTTLQPRPSSVLRRRQRTVLAIAGAVLILLAGACGGDEPSSGTNGTILEGVDDGAEITMWTRAATQAQSEALVKAYNDSHKNKVKLTVIPTDDYQPRVGAAAGSKELPDLLSVDVVFAPNYTSQGLFQDITARIDALPFAANIAPSHIKVGTYENKKYVVPHTMDLSVLFYNKQLYQRAGLDPAKPPATLEEFAEQARKIDALGGNIHGTFFGGNCGGCLVFTWWPSLWADGEQVMNEDGTESLLNSEPAKQVYAVYRGLVEDDIVAPGFRDEAGPTWTGVFPKGNIGIMPMPSTTLGQMPANLDVAVAPIRGLGGGESTFVGGDSIGISANSKVSNQAWHFLAWTLSEQAQVEVVAKNKDVIARTDLATNKYSSQDPRLVTINQVAAKGVTPYALKFGQTFNDPQGPWLPLVRDAVFGDASKIDARNDAVTASLGGG